MIKLSADIRKNSKLYGEINFSFQLELNINTDEKKKERRRFYRADGGDKTDYVIEFLDEYTI